MFNCSARCLQCPLYLYYKDFKKNPLNRIRTPQSANPVTVETKMMKHDKKNISAELRIPVFKSSQYSVSVQKISQGIESDIMEFDRQMQEAAEEYSALAVQQGEKFIPYKISTIYQVAYNKNAFISVTVVYYEFVGGKNSYIKTAYNYNLKTGQPISLKDLFISGSDYKSVINNEIREELTINKDKYFPGAAQNFKGIADDQPFYLENDGIAVFFGFHQIAPMESKIPTIRIPYSKLKNIIKPIFLA